MKNSDYQEFHDLMLALARLYPPYKPDDETIAAYFKPLSFMSIEIVTEAIERAASVHPTFYPKCGELIAICQNVVEEMREANKRRKQSAKSEWSRIGKCSHVYEFQQEGDGSQFLTGFLCCLNCPKVRPVFNRDKAFTKQTNYLATAMSVQPETRQQALL